MRIWMIALVVNRIYKTYSNINVIDSRNITRKTFLQLAMLPASGSFNKFGTRKKIGQIYFAYFFFVPLQDKRNACTSKLALRYLRKQALYTMVRLCISLIAK